MTGMTTRIGVDIGGTFTDLVLHDPARGVTHTGKRLTTTDDPSRAIIEGVQRLLQESGIGIADVRAIVHGTTLITNTVLERTGAKVGLLTSSGFRDILEMGREIRYDVDDLLQEPVPPIVPRQRRIGIRGRILADGREFEALDRQAVVDAATNLIEREGAEALAISFLHAYRNPDHERAARAAIAARYPALHISISSEVACEIREYDRTSTTCLNAYVQPRVKNYLRRLSGELASIGFVGDLTIMLSSGGVTSVDDAIRFPIRLIESGPAAGAMAAAHIAKITDERNVISFDMGGTTAKMCVIDDFAPQLKHDFEAGRLDKFKPGSGLPLKVTVVDLIEIGSGGGSIAAVDPLGLLRVGPRSASSLPGPVCYGRGGAEPTVTDADLLLGHLNPDFFLGGEMALRVDAVKAALRDKLCPALERDDAAAARGIRAIVDESMAAATRMHLAEKGRDARNYTLFAFGGAGPVHAYALAKSLKVSRIIVPLGAGVISAFGFLVAPPAADFVRGYLSPLAQIDWMVVRQMFAEMEEAARDLLGNAPRSDGDLAIKLSADMRYAGQGFEVTTEFPRSALVRGDASVLSDAFAQTYSRRLGRSVQGIPVEVVNWRLAASLPGHDFRLTRKAKPTPRSQGTRFVYFGEFGMVEAAILDRSALTPGDHVAGPAVFEECESSFAMGPDGQAVVDQHYNLIISIGTPDDRAPYTLQ